MHLDHRTCRMPRYSQDSSPHSLSARRRQDERNNNRKREKQQQTHSPQVRQIEERRSDENVRCISIAVLAVSARKIQALITFLHDEQWMKGEWKKEGNIQTQDKQKKEEAMKISDPSRTPYLLDMRWRDSICVDLQNSGCCDIARIRAMTTSLCFDNGREMHKLWLEEKEKTYSALLPLLSLLLRPPLLSLLTHSLTITPRSGSRSHTVSRASGLHNREMENEAQTTHPPSSPLLLQIIVPPPHLHPHAHPHHHRRRRDTHSLTTTPLSRSRSHTVSRASGLLNKRCESRCCKRAWDGANDWPRPPPEAPALPDAEAEGDARTTGTLHIYSSASWSSWRKTPTSEPRTT